MSSKQVDLFGLSIGSLEPVRLMGVLNLSPESFYKESVVQTLEKTKSRIKKFVNEGAEILDFGAKSTAPVDIYGRPNFVSPEEEIKRLTIPLKAFEELDTDVLISIDTQSSEVAKFGLSNGAKIINDISGFKDPEMTNIISSYGAGAVIMPAKEKPGDAYTIPQIKKSLSESLLKAENSGMDLSKIILDPGIGGWVPQRTPKDDYNILKNLDKIRVYSHPILVALSRKSFIGATLAAPPEKRFFGSLAATAIAVVNGANIIRTHDILGTKDVIRIAEQLRK